MTIVISTFTCSLLGNKGVQNHQHHQQGHVSSAKKKNTLDLIKLKITELKTYITTSFFFLEKPDIIDKEESKYIED